MKKNHLWVLIILLFFIVGCSSNSEKSTDEMNHIEVETSQESAGFAEGGDAELIEMDSNQGTDEQQQERMVIFQGEIAIEVKDYHKAANVVKKETEKLGGYIVESSYTEERAEEVNGTIIVRIPKKFFHSFLEYVADNDGKVLHQSTNGNDVTEEFVDLDSRLKSKHIVEERLLAFMEKADSTDNLLKISNELATVQEEIEQIVGKMQYFENQVDLSTITIYIQERRVEMTSFNDEGSLNTWEHSKNMFISTINILFKMSSRLVVFLIGLSPIIISLGCLVGGMIILKRRKKKNQQNE